MKIFTSDLTGKKFACISVDVKGVKDTEKCFIRRAGMKYHVDLHAIVDGEISVKDWSRYFRIN